MSHSTMKSSSSLCGQPLEIEQQQLAEIVERCFANVLAETVQSRATPLNIEPTSAVQASIMIYGKWNLELRLVTCEQTARYIASEMLDQDPAGLMKDDVYNALGEFINLIGENAKSLFGESCFLSLHCVGGLAKPSPQPLETLSYVCNQRPLDVSLLQW